MRHTVSINVSTHKKLFVTNETSSNISVELIPSDPLVPLSETQLITLNKDSYDCVFENVAVGNYTIKSYATDSLNNKMYELSGNIKVQDGILAPGQLIEPETWEAYQRLSIKPPQKVVELEIPTLMHVIVT
jgi:hypothetical protein